MESSAENYSNKKTIYLTDLEGKAREAIYETQDMILNFCWIDNDSIAIYGGLKEKEFTFVEYVKFIDIHTKEMTDYIVSQYPKGLILVSPDKNAILLDDNKLFVKKGNKNLVLLDFKNKDFLKPEERLNGINKDWDCYTIIARYIGTSSWAYNNEFTAGINYNGDLSLTDLNIFETKILRKSYQK